MSDQELVPAAKKVRDFERRPYLDAYLQAYREETGQEPVLTAELTAEDDFGTQDVLYPLADGYYVHLRPTKAGLSYHVIEPPLDEATLTRLAAIREDIFRAALYRPPPQGQEELEQNLLALFDEVGGAGDLNATLQDAMKRRLIRDVARFGPLQPFLLDPYLEDIQGVGTDEIHVIHKYYDMIPSNVQFPDLDVLDGYIRNLSERIGRPVSDSRPIVDATLPDGSRINIVYSEDVSKKGPSFSIRRVHADPISITQIIQWGTMTAEMAAYVWLCLENGMSLFVCGEAACGKSATLNALMGFINARDKIYTAEDTPEVRPPHPVWQRLLTRDTGPVDARVTMFDLLKAALRSRPNYIVVGEIRGAEGNVAFQAMQTGHPTVATFHATDKVKMIQRLSADPINVPLSFMDNLNVAIFQQAIYRDGRLIRRVTAVDEIQGYSERDGGVITLPVFSYKDRGDTHIFQGNNNSFILEKKIAEQHGYEDPSEIYRVLQHRAAVLTGMVEHGITRFDDVNQLLIKYNDLGDDALPFKPKSDYKGGH
ncbi:MAG: type II/IV secretion system ATPase subunit [Thermoplasmatota archaeon]